MGKLLGYIILGIVLIGALSYFLATQPGEHDEFAKCITENDATMFGAYWCPHCTAKKEMFGKSVKLLNYVECSLPNRGGETEVCKVANIESYPTWEIKGVRHPGTQQLSTLSHLTGCPL